MCKMCEKLKVVPKDKKETVVLKDYSRHAIDANNLRAFMQVNHEDDGTPYAFLKFEVDIESTGRSYGIAVGIEYCPFCGEKVVFA